MLDTWRTSVPLAKKAPDIAQCHKINQIKNYLIGSSQKTRFCRLCYTKIKFTIIARTSPVFRPSDPQTPKPPYLCLGKSILSSEEVSQVATPRLLMLGLGVIGSPRGTQLIQITYGMWSHFGIITHSKSVVPLCWCKFERRSDSCSGGLDIKPKGYSQATRDVLHNLNLYWMDALYKWFWNFWSESFKMRFKQCLP